MEDDAIRFWIDGDAAVDLPGEMKLDARFFLRGSFDDDGAF
jgi:hypothetical protein